MTGALARANAAIDLKRWDTAKTEAQHAVAADPTNAEAHGALARALQGALELSAALAAADTALGFAPANERFHRIRGSILVDSGELRQALASIDEAIRLAPGVAHGHGLRARALLRLDEVDAARSACRRAIELDPALAWLHRTLGQIELGAVDRRAGARAAEQAFREALRLEPEDASALNNLGVAVQRQGRSEEAALAYKAAVLVDPTLTVAKSNAYQTLQYMTRLVIGGGVVTFFCLLFGFQLLPANQEGEGSWGSFALLAAIVLGAFGLGAASTRVRRRRRVARLKRRDPALWALYEKLEHDHEAGRL